LRGRSNQNANKTQAASPLSAAKALSPKALKLLERAKEFEPSTPTLARFGSMNYLFKFRYL
jgi:hypothetical protein